MGLFKKKRRTTVEKINKKITLSKIVKFSYLQTLAIDGGLTTTKEIAGETEAKQSTSEDVKNKKNFNDRIIDFVQKPLDLFDSLFGDLPNGLGDLTRSLFGKKRTTTTKVDIKESGWSLTKVWNQPQFDIIRYAIGVKELTVAQFTYEPVSEIISKPWASPKEIVKIVLTVDQFIPNIFPPGNYIEYYIKPNIEEADWVRINPLGTPSVFNEDGSIVPRIINFNTERPLSSRLEDSYITTSTPVKEVIFKAILRRPESIEGSTSDPNGYSPILKSYRILMTPRNGL